MKCAILRDSVRLTEKTKWQVVSVNFNWVRLACVITLSKWAARDWKGQTMNYKVKENQLSANYVIALREIVGWGNSPIHQIEVALENSWYVMSVVHEGRVIGIGRIVGDGVTICYIQDVIVLPEYQGKGIGTAIMKHLIAHIRKNGFENTRITIGLFAAKEKEDFYEKFGFYIRPNENRGAGMEMIMKI